MVELNVGCNFDKRLLTGIEKLNKKYQHNDIQVTQLYGSLRSNVIGIPTARPNTRIPHIGIISFREFIDKCRKNGITFNYTMNAPNIDLYSRHTKPTLQKYITILINLGIELITVSSSYLLDSIKQMLGSIKLELSTIMDIDDLSSIHEYCSLDYVEKICLSITRNRDISFLKKISKYPIELLVNEFCSYKGLPCQQFFRRDCYHIHASNCRLKINTNYPLKYCSDSRSEYPDSWLKARVIYPWDLDKYIDIGITKFKISGRTLGTKHVLMLVESYLSKGKKYPKNLLELWGHIEKSSDNFLKGTKPPVFIRSEVLIKKDFTKRWFNFPDFRCSEIMCSECRYCSKFYKRCKRYGI